MTLTFSKLINIVNSSNYLALKQNKEVVAACKSYCTTDWFFPIKGSQLGAFCP